MPSIPFGTSAYARLRGNLPDLPVINLFAEQAPTEGGGITLQSRPGIARNLALGAGPIRGGFQADGVLSGQRFVVSGSTLYSGTASLGAITGTGPVSFAASAVELLIAAGDKLYSYNGTDLVAVTLPDGFLVAKIAFIAGYFVALRKGTQQFHWSKVLDGRVWDGLDFANAENEPDRLLDMVVVDDVLILLGSSSVEFWPKTGDANLPFAPTAGKVFSKGIIATGCVVPYDNTFAYIGIPEQAEPPNKPSPRIYLAGNVPTGVSDPGIEEQLSLSTSFALWTFALEGHEFLVARLSTGSWLFDASTRQWCEFQSWKRPNWRVQCAVGGLLGDDSEGQLWAWAGYTDDGGVLERRFRGGVPITGGTVTCDNLRLATNPGQTDALTGYFADPTVEMRSSRDRANTWTAWRGTALGEQGKYRTRVEWRRNGRFDDPGALFEFRVTDPVPFSPNAVNMNEASGGRSR